MRLSRVAIRLAAGLVVGCVSCAAVVGLEDKELRTDDVAADGSSSDGRDDAGEDPKGTAPEGELVVAQQKHPLGLAVDDAYVYWASDLTGTISRAPKQAKATPTVIGKDQAKPALLVADTSFIYWHVLNTPPRLTDSGAMERVTTIGRLLKGTGNDTVLELANDDKPQYVRAMALYNGPALADGGTDPTLFVAYADRVRRYARAQQQGRDVVQGGSANSPVAVAVDDTYVYWFSATGTQVWRRLKNWDAVGNPPPEMVGPPLNASIVKMIATPQSLVLLATSGAVLRMDKVPPAGAPVTIVQTPPSPRSMELSGTDIFLVRSQGADDGEILRVAEGKVAVLARNQRDPRELAVDVNPVNDERTVYWTNYGEGTIRRVAVLP